MPVYLLLLAFTIWMAVEAVRRGQAQSWLWIILFFGPLGAAVYFFSEYVHAAVRGPAFRPRKVSADELRQAEIDARRLDSGPTWTAYASALRARQSFPRAVEAARTAVERDPSSLGAHYELGLALLGADRPGEAVPSLQQVVTRDRGFDSSDALYALARAQDAAGDVASARTTLEELATRSARPEILYDLATAQARLGDREAARGNLRRIVDEAELVPRYLYRNVKPWVRKARQGLRKLGA